MKMLSFCYEKMFTDRFFIDRLMCVYMCMFVGCVVLVNNKWTTKQNNIGHST